MVELRVFSGKSAGRIAPVTCMPFQIGRSSKAGLSLSDPGVWEQHVTLEQDSVGQFLIRAGAGATVSVQGAAVQVHRLRNGDQFVCGAARIGFWIAPGRVRSQLAVERALWLGLLCVVFFEIGLILKFLD
jgi:hypothetical protein